MLLVAGCKSPAGPESCILSPEDCPEGTICDPVTQRCVDAKLGFTERCRDASGCPDSARPLCLAGYCVPCTSMQPAQNADAACRSLGQSLGLTTLVACVRDGSRKGQCGECRPATGATAGVACPAPSDNGASTSATPRPVCDDGMCRPCRLHGECDSGLCNDGSGIIDSAVVPDVAVGACVPESRLAFVDGGRCSPGGGADGSRGRPYCDLAAAAAAPYVVIQPPASPGEVYPAVSFSDGKRRVFVGPGRDAGTLLAGLAVSGAGTSAVLIDAAVDSYGGAAALSCGGGGRLGLVRVSVDLHSATSIGIDAAGCERVELSESRVVRSHGAALRINGGAHTYRVVNSMFSSNGGPSAVVLGATASGVFAFNTLVNNGVLSGAGQDGGAVSCETGAAPLLSDSLIVQNGRSKATDPKGGPLGTQFVGPCQLQRVVVGQDAAAATAPGQVIAAIPDLDTKLRLMDTPNNASCCIDKAGSCGDLKLDYFGDPRPLGTACDLGAHELR